MREHRWLVLRLEAPLLAFGGVTIDHIGVTRDFPAASMLTGLLGNALGWRRTDTQAHQNLQDRLVFGARRDRENAQGILTDTQNVQMSGSDGGWTTWGTPEKRGGGTYGAPHRRLRDYHVDASVTVVLRLIETDESAGPDLDALVSALERPARPLFIGRKPCLPTEPLLQDRRLEAATVHEALMRVPPRDSGPRRLRALWPEGEGPDSGNEVDRIVALADLRNWRTGLHGGTRLVVEGWMTPSPAGSGAGGQA